MKSIGCIKWDDNTKGFGVVVSISGEEFFVHRSNLELNGCIPEVGTNIIFEGKNK